MTDEKDVRDLQKAMKQTWLLVVIGLIYIGVFFALAVVTNLRSPPPDWDMGGTSFVPASSPYAEGYYQPVSSKSAVSTK